MALLQGATCLAPTSHPPAWKRGRIGDTVAANRATVEKVGLAVIAFIVVWLVVGIEIALLTVALVAGLELILGATGSKDGGDRDGSGDDPPTEHSHRPHRRAVVHRRTTTIRLDPDSGGRPMFRRLQDASLHDTR